MTPRFATRLLVAFAGLAVARPAAAESPPRWTYVHVRAGQPDALDLGYPLFPAPVPAVEDFARWNAVDRAYPRSIRAWFAAAAEPDAEALAVATAALRPSDSPSGRLAAALVAYAALDWGDPATADRFVRAGIGAWRDWGLSPSGPWLAYEIARRTRPEVVDPRWDAWLHSTLSVSRPVAGAAAAGLLTASRYWPVASADLDFVERLVPQHSPTIGWLGATGFRVANGEFDAARVDLTRAAGVAQGFDTAPLCEPPDAATRLRLTGSVDGLLGGGDVACENYRDALAAWQAWLAEDPATLDSRAALHRRIRDCLGEASGSAQAKPNATGWTWVNGGLPPDVFACVSASTEDWSGPAFGFVIQVGDPVAAAPTR